MFGSLSAGTVRRTPTASDLNVPDPPNGGADALHAAPSILVQPAAAPSPVHAPVAQQVITPVAAGVPVTIVGPAQGDVAIMDVNEAPPTLVVQSLLAAARFESQSIDIAPPALRSPADGKVNAVEQALRHWNAGGSLALRAARLGECDEIPWIDMGWHEDAASTEQGIPPVDSAETVPPLTGNCEPRQRHGWLLTGVALEGWTLAARQIERRGRAMWVRRLSPPKGSG
jgi:hypothetical protein